MNCPRCNVMLLMTERNGIEIDYCPQCRGVWLDRGELDKIIQKSSSEFETYNNDRYGNDYSRRPDYREDSYHKGKYHRKKNFWEELFD